MGTESATASLIQSRGSPNPGQQYIIQSTIPISIVAAATPKISAQRNPLLPPSVMVIAVVPRSFSWGCRTALSIASALVVLGCTETTSPARRYAVLEDLGTGDWQTVAVGSDHSCALKTNGSAYCWGSNAVGQLGVARFDTTCGSGKTAVGCSMSPAQVQPDTRFAAISAGARHTCAITRAREAFCWGANDFGQVSEFSAGGPTPVRIAGTLGWAAVSAGFSHTCAIRTDGALFCWGSNDRGQLGNGQVAATGGMTRVSLSSPVASVSAGQGRTCARTTLGAVYCWGAVWTASQNGLELTRSQRTPQPVPGAPAMAWVAVGSFTTCGADLLGLAYCWEANPRGEMGTGATGGSTSPLRVASDLEFLQISAGIVHSCGVVTSGAGYCWGDDTFGQLGVSPSTLTEHCGAALNICSTTPVPLFGRQRFTEISAGFGSHACGVTVQGNLYCWGLGLSGQRGDGSENYAISTPILVAEPSPH